MPQRRDRIFVLVLAIILVNLVFWTASAITTVSTHPASAWAWSYLIAHFIAVVGTLYLMRSYFRGRKLAKRMEREQDKSHK